MDTVKLSDIPKPPEHLKTHSAYSEFSAKWTPVPDEPLPSVSKTFFSLFFFDYLKISLLQVLSTTLPFAQPLLLKQLILFVDRYNSGKAPLSQGISLVTLSATVMLIDATSDAQIALLTSNLSSRLQTALSQAVHQKALRLSPASVAETSVGELVNILSNNVAELTAVLPYLHMVWSTPLQITVCWLTMYSMIGNAMWVGMGALLLVVPATAFISKLKWGLFVQIQTIQERRYTLTNNLMSNIKSVKLYGWESTYYDKVDKVRTGEELAIIKKMGYFSSLEIFLLTCCNALSSTSAFAFIVLVQHLPLNASSAIPALNLFGKLLQPVIMIPYVVQFIMQATVAMGKIRKFLELTEVSTHAPNDSLLVSGSFFWDKDLTKPAVDISYSAKKGDLVSIIGKVGTGKTATLLASLGELFSGSASVPGSVAYVSQEPWILNATVKDNILFGSKEDPVFYSRVIEACALSVDLESLADGDQTEVGEKGISLSGGQKARIALARAVYSRADVHFYDDPLSAVDEHVQSHLIKYVFCGLLKDKTVIVATNTVNLLRHLSSIYLIEEQKFVEQGDFETLMQGGKVKALVDEFQSVHAAEPVQELKDLDLEPSLSRSSSVSHFSVLTLADEDIRRTRVENEVKESESDISALYKHYFYAAGVHNIVFYFLFSLVGAGLGVLGTYWVAKWGTDISLSDMQLVLGYFLIGIVSALFSALAWLVWAAFGSVRASKVLHDNMLKAVIRAPMSFFETTPLGRLTTRFSQDMFKIDWQMTMIIISFLGAIIASFSTLAVIMVSSPTTLIVIVPALYLYRRTQQYYLLTSRQVRRLSAATMSPVLSHFQETLNGLTTVRAFKKTRFFSTKSTAHIDVRTKTAFLQTSLQEWLSLRLTAIGVAIFLASGLSLVGTLPYRALSAGLVGLVMSYASTISSALSRVVEASIAVEQESVVLERVHEFSSLVPEKIGGKEPPAHWPNNGEIVFSDYSTKYREGLDEVLSHVTFTVKSREKIGVVGRTGAGKSSLTMALFRIIEASAGGIFIDGEDISKLGLETLRSRLSIIPQDAQMFEGTIRSNLDPAGKFSDEQLQEVLNHASLEFELDTKLTDGGSNLSLGQKQLLCLGRALLTPSSVLVLDEATAAVDYETDKLIQETIRREFKDRTILTIAHRLNTVMDSDKIMVLDAGQVVEFGSPQELLEKKGFFYKLVNDKEEGDSK